MSKVKSINFTFENCESCVIPIEYIYSFSLSEISKTKSYYPNNQGISETNVASKLFVHFENIFADFEGVTTCDELTVKRLNRYKDICWFGISYEDGTDESYYVTWKGGSDYENTAQKLETTSFGLTLEIGYD